MPTKSRVHNVEIIKLPGSHTSFWLAALALAAVLVSLSQSQLVKQHNAISVRPLLDVEYHLDADHEWTIVFLANDGLGPAVVKWAEVRLDGRRPKNSHLNGWTELKQSFPDVQPTPTHEFYIREEVIRADAQKPLIRLPNLQKTVEARNKNVNFLRRIQHVICYCSLYGDCWTFSVRLPGDRKTSHGCVSGAELYPETIFESLPEVLPPDLKDVPPSAFPDTSPTGNTNLASPAG